MPQRLSLATESLTPSASGRLMPTIGAFLATQHDAVRGARHAGLIRREARRFPRQLDRGQPENLQIAHKGVD